MINHYSLVQFITQSRDIIQWFVRVSISENPDFNQILLIIAIEKKARKDKERSAKMKLYYVSFYNIICWFVLLPFVCRTIARLPFSLLDEKGRAAHQGLLAFTTQSGGWIFPCAHFWGAQNSKVVCRQLGHRKHISTEFKRLDYKLFFNPKKTNLLRLTDRVRGTYSHTLMRF